MYATVEQVNTYVTNYYSSSSSLRISWEALSVDDKQVFINNAERIIDRLPLQGKEVIKGKAFPRVLAHEDDTEAVRAASLKAAQDATCELSIHLNGDNEYFERMSLQKQGVASYKIGDLSETFRDNASHDEITYASSIVLNVLGPWLSGGFRICHTHGRR